MRKEEFIALIRGIKAGVEPNEQRVKYDSEDLALLYLRARSEIEKLKRLIPTHWKILNFFKKNEIIQECDRLHKCYDHLYNKFKDKE